MLGRDVLTNRLWNAPGIRPSERGFLGCSSHPLDWIKGREKEGEGGTVMWRTTGGSVLNRVMMAVKVSIREMVSMSSMIEPPGYGYSEYGTLGQHVNVRVSAMIRAWWRDYSG